MSGNLAWTEWLCSRGVPLDAICGRGGGEDAIELTPLHAACKIDSASAALQLQLVLNPLRHLPTTGSADARLDDDLLRWLLDKQSSAQRHLCAPLGKTVLHLACDDQEQPKAVVRRLRVLHASLGDEVMQIFLKKKEARGWTPSHYLADYNNVLAAELLMQHNCFLDSAIWDTQDREGNTPLIWAARAVGPLRTHTHQHVLACFALAQPCWHAPVNCRVGIRWYDCC